MTNSSIIVPQFIIFLIMSVAIAPSCSGNNSGTSDIIPRKALSRLNATIKSSDYYSEKKNRSLDSLKSIIRNCPNGIRKWGTTIELATQYRQIDTDSAIHYAKIAATGTPFDAPDNLYIKGRLSLVNALSTAGLFPSAIRRLDSIRPMLSDIDSKIEFWISSRMLFSYMTAFAQDQGEYADLFRSRYIECDDSLLKLLPKADPFYRFIYSERLVNEGRWEDAKKHLQQLLDNNPRESNIYGMAAYQLAEVYKHKGDFKMFAECLSLSAESDIMGCIKEGIALPALAKWLYEQGDLSNAYSFINFALEEANSGNTRMRTVTIAALMPLIDQAYRKKIADSHDKMVGYSLTSSALLLIAIALFIVLLRNIRDSKAKGRKLAISHKKLEAYVGNFIGLCANYSTRLDQFAKLVIRKINAHQTDDLLKLVSSGRFTEEDNEEFYRLIDKAILDIFPDFVDNINTLLSPEKRIILKPDESLNPELRIYAFVRMGVDQSTRIAQILHYSVNTVYTYRNRMRNRAINRDNFDADVANLERSSQSFFPTLISE